MSEQPVRVLLVDDHEVFVESLAMALSAQPDVLVVGVATSLAKATAVLASALPDVVLLDHRLPDGDGVAAIVELTRIRPSARVVMLTASTSERVLVDALDAGAAGFVDKSRGLDDVLRAVRAAAAGEVAVSPAMMARLMPRLRQGRVVHELTTRERDVLEQLAEGLSNAEIAAALGVSVNTVRGHVANVSAKLGARSKLEVLSIAVRDGLLPGR